MVRGPKQKITQTFQDNALALTSSATNSPIVVLSPSNSNIRGDIYFSTTRTSDASSPSESDLWYNATSHRLRLYDGTTTASLLTTGDLTLQGAYDGGQSISGASPITYTYTSTAAVALTVTGTATNNVNNLINVVNSGQGYGLQVSGTGSLNEGIRVILGTAGSGNTTGIGIAAVGRGGATASAPLIQARHGFTTEQTGNVGVVLLQQSTAVNASQTILLCDEDGAGTSNGMIRARATQSANQAVLLRLDHTATNASSVAGALVLQINNSSAITSIDINQDGNGVAINASKTNTGSANVISITNSGTGDSILVTQDGNGVVLDITKSNTGSANIIQINNSSTGNDLRGTAGQSGTALWQVDSRGHALLSSTPSRLKNILNGSNTFGSTERWEQIAMSSAQGAASLDAAYYGSVFDGTNIYFATNSSDTMIMYNTTKAFTSIDSWEQLALSSAQGAAALDNAYLGMTFDGQYVYYVPRNSTTFIRHDTRKFFTNTAAWQQIALSSGANGASPGSNAFFHCSFDGRYVYFGPFSADTFVRYDTTLSFTAIASWTQLAMSSGQGGATLDNAYHGVTFDGRYVYYVPSSSTTFIRYDTTASFTAIASWTQIAMSSAQGNTAVSNAYVGATFDGRYVYYAPFDSVTFVRFDTIRNFTSLLAWQQIAVTSAQGATGTVASQFQKALFDGRYIYYMAFNADTFVRFDTTASFTAVSSWKQVSISSAQGAAVLDRAYVSASFDGQYVYYTPEDSDTFIRFTANNTGDRASVEYAQVS